MKKPQKLLLDRALFNWTNTLFVFQAETAPWCSCQAQQPPVKQPWAAPGQQNLQGMFRTSKGTSAHSICRPGSHAKHLISNQPLPPTPVAQLPCQHGGATRQFPFSAGPVSALLQSHAKALSITQSRRVSLCENTCFVWLPKHCTFMEL